MATADTRAYSKNYSGLLTETYLALAVAGICVTSFELMRSRRRKTKSYKDEVSAGTNHTQLGSEETWEFGYLFQGRCWAKRPSPAMPRWPLAWVKQIIMFPEAAYLPLVGPDTTVYARFLRGNWYFCLLHTFTTLPILLPIHLHFAPPSSLSGVDDDSMTRVSLSNLISSSAGKRLLPVHLCLLLWFTVTWILNILWIIRGAFRYRRQAIVLAAERANDQDDVRQSMLMSNQEDTLAEDKLRGWRLKTIMVTNIPVPLRDEKILKEYFEFYLARVTDKPIPAPGPVEGIVSFVSRFYQAQSTRDKRIVAGINEIETGAQEKEKNHEIVGIEKVVVVRKMAELTSLMARREEVMRKLEEAHIQLAQAALKTVAEWIEKKEKGGKAPARYLHKVARKEAAVRLTLQSEKENVHDIEIPTPPSDAAEEARMNELAQALGPYIEEFGMRSSRSITSPRSWIHRTVVGGASTPTPEGSPEIKVSPHGKGIERPSLWEVLYSLPRAHLDQFQPLVRLKSLFRGAHVPMVDYYTTKLGLLTALITEQRSQPPSSFSAASTAFVTFSSPETARKAVTLLPSHPKNPLSCLAQPAPEFADIDWTRLMKTTFTGEFLRNWVVDFAVWVFTLIWIIPVSSIVALVSVQNLGSLWPALKRYLNENPTKQNLLTNLLPTLLVTGLSILIPLILLLIAKKAHNIVLLSKLHDQILTRYYKFLVCNVLIFFCVGVSALQSFLTSFKQAVDVFQVVASKFPDAAPFYVGWLIFTTAMHAGLELGLLGLPLLVYRATVLHATTPGRRKAGTRPRTFNFYYWLPNHLIVLFINFTFTLLNPLVIPFGLFYFSIVLVVFKHQFLHVYSKAYEMNASVLLIRIQRYSMDGIILAQVIFFTLMIISKEKALAGLTGLFFSFTAIFKIGLTRFIKYNFAQDAIFEAEMLCGPTQGSMNFNAVGSQPGSGSGEEPEPPTSPMSKFHNFFHRSNHIRPQPDVPSKLRMWTWKNPANGVQFAYKTLPAQNRKRDRGVIPFGPHSVSDNAGITDFTRAFIEEKHVPPVEDITMSGPHVKEIADGPREVRHSSQLDMFKGRRHGLVIRHEIRQPWDDAPRLDIAYENPAFTTPIENVLWLPSNPCTILDLDDTVLMYRAITSDPNGGALGEWLNDTNSMYVEAPHTARRPEDGFIPEETDVEWAAGNDQLLTGLEEIEFSPGIRSRVDSLSIREDEEGDRSSFFGMKRPINRRQSSSKSTRSNLGGARSFSGGTVTSAGRKTLRPMTSHASTSQWLSPGPSTGPMQITPRTQRIMSVGSRSRMRSQSNATTQYSISPIDPVHQVESRSSQIPFANHDLSPILSTHPTVESPNEDLNIPAEMGGRTTLGIGRPSRRRGSILSDGGRSHVSGNNRGSIAARDALANEVLVEEQEASEKVRREEEKQVEAEEGKKPWYSSWLYRHSQRHDQ
ncbi:hypothetical protein FRB95_014030 [Tulasnella sp. JGI-2019a]|nr:hypothetical protein FRB95_014030 [Tulasnella sp. JGI-2019a]